MKGDKDKTPADRYFPEATGGANLRYIDPFWGVDGGGNCLCGPYLPLGLARPGPDTEIPHPTSGYRSADPIMTFSQTHVSGTGGGGRYGNIGLLPYAGRPRRYPGSFDKADECASAGYYAVALTPGDVRAELTCTHRCAIHRIHFPCDRDANVRVDLSAVIRVEVADCQWLGHAVGQSTGGRVEVVDDHCLQGRADLRGGWGTPEPYSVYFFLRFDKPFSRCWLLDGAALATGPSAEGAGLQADCGFGPVEQLEARVGISFVSIAKARAAVERECINRSFAACRKDAEQQWAGVTSMIEVEGGTEDDKKLLYSSLYRLFCMPTDRGVDDELEKWRSGVRHFSEFYCLWDSVRNANSFFALAVPELQRDFLNCLLDIADHTGWLPDAWICSHHGTAQGGSAADVLFAEAAQKGMGGIDYEKALRYMLKNYEKDSPDPQRRGRRGISEYRELGYVPADVKGCLSLTVEYALQDWAAGTLAQHLGRDQVAASCLERGQNVWNLWHDQLRALCPRHADGGWVEPYDITRPTRPDYWNDPYCYEGTALEWSACIHHDIDGWISRIGGKDELEAYLDRFFDGGFWFWKEIILHTPWLYHYTDHPEKSGRAAHHILDAKYGTGRDGLPDNEDMGSQSTFVICTLLGLYPQMGKDFYYLSLPRFERTRLRLGTSGNVLEIHAPGLKQGRAGVETVKLNGNPLLALRVNHDQIREGGTIEFVLA